MQIVTDFAVLGQNLSTIYESESSHDPIVALPYDFGFSKKSTFFGGLFLHVCTLLDECSLARGCCGPKEPYEQAEQGFQSSYLFYTAKKIHDVVQKARVEMYHLSGSYCTSIFQSSEEQASKLKTLRSQILTVGSSFDWEDPEKERILQQFFIRVLHLAFIDDTAKERQQLFFESYAMVFIEGVLQQSFPLKSFLVLIQQNDMSVSDSNEIADWVKKVESNKEHLTVGRLHAALRAALRAIVPDLDPSSEDFSKKLYLLEWGLWKHGLHILEAPDKEYLSWRDTLDPGRSTVNSKGELLRIGAKLDWRTPSNTLFFEIEGNDNQVLLFGSNLVQVGMWKASCEEVAYAVQPLECFFADPLGRFWKIEKVDLFLHDIRWTGLEVKQEEIRLQECVQVIKGLLLANEGVPDFTSQIQYCFVKGNKLRVFPMLLQSKLSETRGDGFLFHELEAFCKYLANGNALVYRYLMNQSEMNHDTLAEVYRTVVRRQLLPSWWEQFIDSPKLSIREEVALENIHDEEVVSRLKVLIEFFDETIEGIVSELQPLLRERDDGVLRTSIIEVLLQFQRERGFLSQIHPDLGKKEVLSMLAQDIVRKNSYLFDDSAVRPQESLYTFLIGS